jgi:hypothetical protein
MQTTQPRRAPPTRRPKVAVPPLLRLYQRRRLRLGGLGAAGPAAAGLRFALRPLLPPARGRRGRRRIGLLFAGASAGFGGGLAGRGGGLAAARGERGRRDAALRKSGRLLGSPAGGAPVARGRRPAAEVADGGWAPLLFLVVWHAICDAAATNRLLLSLLPRLAVAPAIRLPKLLGGGRWCRRSGCRCCCNAARSGGGAASGVMRHQSSVMRQPKASMIAAQSYTPSTCYSADGIAVLQHAKAGAPALVALVEHRSSLIAKQFND